MTILRLPRLLLVFAPALLVLALLSMWLAHPAFAQDPTPVVAGGLDLNALVGAIGQHNWLVAVLAVAVYLRFLFSDESKFPLTAHPNLRPLFVGFAGAVVVVVTDRDQGQSWSSSIIAGVVGLIASGFVDGMAVAIFGSTAAAPSWAKTLVGFIDGLTGGGGGSNALKAPPPPANENAAAPPAAKRTGPAALAFAPLLAAVVGVLSGCVGGVPTPQTQAVINASAQLALCVETVYQADESKSPPAPDAQVVLDEGVTCGPDAAILVAAIGQETSQANVSAAIANQHQIVLAKHAAMKGH